MAPVPCVHSNLYGNSRLRFLRICTQRVSGSRHRPLRKRQRRLSIPTLPLGHITLRSEVDGIAAASAPPDSSRSTTATFRLAAQDQHVLLLQQQLQALQTTLAEVLDDRSDRRRRSPKASRSGSSNPGSASREAPAGLAPPRAATGRRRMCVPRQRTRQRAFGTEHLSPAVPDALAGLLL